MKAKKNNSTQKQTKNHQVFEQKKNLNSNDQNLMLTIMLKHLKLTVEMNLPLANENFVVESIFVFRHSPNATKRKSNREKKTFIFKNFYLAISMS